MERAYLDNAATTPLAPEVREAMRPFLEAAFGNPSSRHPLGAQAAAALEAARRTVAAHVGARPEGVVFTSGGTEANNLGVLGFARARRRHGTRVVIGPGEHASVRNAAAALADEGFGVEHVRATAGGGLDLDHLASLLDERTVLVSQMAVSNELGVVYPVERVARLVRANAPNAWLHVDAVQALGKRELSLTALGAHGISISAHKVHGPKGTGALVLAPGVRPKPLFHGGEQEHGLRAGTENVAGCAGMARAVELADAARPAAEQRWNALRARLEAGLAAVPGARLLALAPPCVAAIAPLVLPGPPAEVWMHHLEVHGVMTSVGSACHAKQRAVSPALLSLGLTKEEAQRVLRVSFARDTAEAEIERLLRALETVHSTLAARTR